MGKLSTQELFVVVMGVGTVFIGLICIILLCKIVGLLCGIAGKKDDTPATSAAVTPAAVSEQPIQNKQEIVAAVSAAIAEELGTDISAIRIHSFKKI